MMNSVCKKLNFNYNNPTSNEIFLGLEINLE